jgi:hypothetical protein
VGPDKGNEMEIHLDWFSHVVFGISTVLLKYLKSRW